MFLNQLVQKFEMIFWLSFSRFSFEISENGTIGHVYYPRGESEHVITAKKGLTSLLAANLKHPPGNTVGRNFIYHCLR